MRMARTLLFALLALSCLCIYTQGEAINFNFAGMMNIGKGNSECSGEHDDDTYDACQDDDALFSETIESPFKNLSPEEIKEVVAFLMADAELNITDFETARVSDNFIDSVEVFVPPKASVLSFLDSHGPFPGRYARAVLHNGGKVVPDISEVVVGPLPVSAHTRVMMTHANIPFTTRMPDDKEMAGMEEVVLAEATYLDTLFRESFGASYINCNSEEETCLTWTDSAPLGPTQDKRQSWLWFTFNVEGSYMNPVGLEMLIDHMGTDLSKWHLVKIVYNGVPFDNSADLLAAFNDGKLNKIVPATNIARSSYARVPNPARGLGVNMPGPRTFQPQGSRFSVQDGSHVAYMGWEFDMNVRASSGLGFWDIKFLGERVAYEISLQEAISTYSSLNPGNSRASYLDSNWGMGTSLYELHAGVDCPQHATLIDLHQYSGGKPITYKNALCVFEHELNIPLARHFSFAEDTNGFHHYAGAKSHALVVRSINTVYNYDYIYDHLFYLNGVIELKTSTSGYIQGTYYNELDGSHSTRVSETTSGSLHDHILNFKVDLDIGGTENSFLVRKIEREEVNLPWYDKPHIQKHMVDHILQDESESGIVFDYNHPALYNFINTKQLNKWGNPRGYRLVLKDAIKDILQDDPVHKMMQWAKYQIAVTKHHDDEISSTSLFNQATAEEPFFEFDNYFNNEELVQEDLVAWVSVGIFHAVHAEDAPITTTAGNSASFFLKPNNYFDHDPSTDINEAILLVPGKNGKKYCCA